MENIRINVSEKVRVVESEKKIFDEKDFDFWYFPTPFIWDINADIYFLLANPWLPKNKEEIRRDIELENNYKEIILKNLYWEWSKNEFPLFFLDSKFKGTWWYRWWHKVLKYLIENENIAKEKLSKKIFVLEIYWYHSNKFKINKKIESSSAVKYTQYLLRRAIKEKKIILATRSISNWFKLVPELKSYENCHFLWHRQELIIRNTTLSPWIYNKILKLLKD